MLRARSRLSYSSMTRKRSACRTMSVQLLQAALVLSMRAALLEQLKARPAAFASQQGL